MRRMARESCRCPTSALLDNPGQIDALGLSRSYRSTRLTRQLTIERNTVNRAPVIEQSFMPTLAVIGMGCRT